MSYNRFFATEAYKFFLSNLVRKQNDLLKLDDYLKTIPGYVNSADEGLEKIDLSLAKYVSKICRRMEEDGYLIKVSQHSLIPFYDTYLSVDKVNASNPEEFAQNIKYGCLDYKYQGFPFAYNQLNQSVVPIIGINKDGDPDIGTAFYIGNGLFVTAAHCANDLNSFQLLDLKNQTIEIEEVWFAKNADLQIFDIAIIKTKLTQDIKPFLMEDPEVLTPVMVIGYPPIPGFDAIQVVETATVGGLITNKKSSIGSVVSTANSYLTKMDYFIINARVKGGNSGSPVINENGKVIGILVQIPMDSQGGYDSGRFDLMGYGVCLPSKYIRKVLNNHEIKSATKVNNNLIIHD